MTDKLTKEEWQAQAEDQKEAMKDAMMHVLNNGGGAIIKELVREANAESSKQRFKDNMYDVGRVDLEGRDNEQEFEDDMAFTRRTRKRLSWLVDRFWLVSSAPVILLIIAAFGDGIVGLLNKLVGG